MSTEDTSSTLEINLLQNGIDFILKGIDELFDKEFELKGYINALDVSPTNYKYGILHLFSGFLLLLKERLYRHMPELIFTGKIADVRLKLKNKVPHTVDLDEALERLEIGPRVTFTEGEIQTIRKMREFRNQFEHYQVSVNKYEVWSVVSAFLGLIDKFLVQELQINIEQSTENLILIGKIHQIEAIWSRIEKQRIVYWSEGVNEKLAEFQTNRDEILADLDHTYLREKGAFDMFINCPECYEETLIASGEYAGICSNKECESTYPLTGCDGCGIRTTGFSWEFVLCDECRERIMSSGD
jgi:hypothetical protein